MKTYFTGECRRCRPSHTHLFLNQNSFLRLMHFSGLKVKYFKYSTSTATKVNFVEQFIGDIGLILFWHDPRSIFL